MNYKGMSPRKRSGKKDNVVLQMRDDIGQNKEASTDMERKDSFRKYLYMWD